MSKQRRLPYAQQFLEAASESQLRLIITINEKTTILHNNYTLNTRVTEVREEEEEIKLIILPTDKE